MITFYHETRIDAVLCVKISVIIITRLTMASTKEYLDFVLEQLSLLDDISYKTMMEEKDGNFICWQNIFYRQV